MQLKPSFLAIEWALLLYVVVGSSISYVLPLPELVKALLALPVWLIVPYFFGSSINLVLSHFKLSLFTGFSSIVFSLLSGIFGLIVLTFVLDLAGLSFILSNLYLLLLGISFLYLIVRTFAGVGMNFQITREIGKKYLPILLFCLLVSTIPALMKVSVPGFPYGTVETISIPFEQYQPALRFMEYGYLQHYRVYDFVSLGVCSQLFNLDPLSFIWASPFVMMFVFSFGLYLFAFSITKSNNFSLFAVLFGSFINLNIFRDAPILFKANVFLYIFLPYLLYLVYIILSKNEHRPKKDFIMLAIAGIITISYVYLIESNVWSFFVPQNLIYPLEWRSHVWLPMLIVSMIPVLFSIIMVTKKFGKNISTNWIIFFASFFLLAFLNSEAYAFVLFVAGFLAFSYIKNNFGNNKLRLLLLCFILLVFCFVLFQYFIYELPLTNPISSLILPKYSTSAEILSFSARFEWIFIDNLSLPLVLLLIFGTIGLAVSKSKTSLFMLSIFALALFLYLFPEVFAYRFFREVSITMALVLASGACCFIHFLKFRNRSRILLLVLLIFLFLFPSMIAPIYSRYNTIGLGQPIISNYEYNASNWLKANTSLNTLLISDFESMQLLAPLSNKLLPTDRDMVVEGLSADNIATVWQIKNMFLTSSFNYSLDGSNDVSYWSNYGFGKGTISIDNSDSSMEKTDTVTTLAITEGDKSTVGIIHKFSDKQDWSNASGLYFYWYGQNTSSTWQICVSAPDDSNWFALNFKDDFVGLQKVYASFGAFSKVGNPSWSTVSYIAVRTSNATPDIWYLGDIGLSYVSGGIDLNLQDVTYLKTHLSSTDTRYTEKTQIAMLDPPIYIVLSPRTVDWIGQDGISGVITPSENSVPESYLQLFENNPNLKLVYNFETQIYIFQVIDPSSINGAEN